ncbi:uncharacterized protein LOC124112631 [Haliotis rufescens]|uniref:uncharacterized protein LOC124112631 n=1 Tax=Haliotis rufescens TaxID=6454 RepID=UPI001EB06776|nr:uncharacterized protein LOC124112631 [Haliotis rufescens]
MVCGGMSIFFRLVLLCAGIVGNQACDPNFCKTRAHGEPYCDPADNTSHYVCDNGVAKHSTCQPGLVYRIDYCAWPHEGACVPNPVPDTSNGVVVNGICQSSGPTGSTQATLQNTENAVLWHLYRRHRHLKSSCTVHQTLITVTSTQCASFCTQTNGCTDYNISILGDRYECQLLACLNDFLLDSSLDHDFYEQI